MAFLPFLNQPIRDAHNTRLLAALVKHQPSNAFGVEIHFPGSSVLFGLREGDEDAVVLLSAWVDVKCKVSWLLRCPFNSNIYADVFPGILGVCWIIGMPAQYVRFKDAAPRHAVGVPFHKRFGPFAAGSLFILRQRAQ